MICSDEARLGKGKTILGIESYFCMPIFFHKPCDFEGFNHHISEMRRLPKNRNFFLLDEIGEDRLHVFRREQVFPPLTIFAFKKSSPASFMNAAIEAQVNLYYFLKAR